MIPFTHPDSELSFQTKQDRLIGSSPDFFQVLDLIVQKRSYIHCVESRTLSCLVSTGPWSLYHHTICSGSDRLWDYESTPVQNAHFGTWELGTGWKLGLGLGLDNLQSQYNKSKFWHVLLYTSYRIQISMITTLYFHWFYIVSISCKQDWNQRNPLHILKSKNIFYGPGQVSPSIHPSGHLFTDLLPIIQSKYS